MPHNNVLTKSYMDSFTRNDSPYTVSIMELGTPGAASRLGETLLPFLDELNILWVRFMTEVS
jgi:hypothetical protein